MKKILLLLIGIIPFNKFKILLYKLIFNYKIDWSAKIGVSYICCKSVNIQRDVKIGHFNFFNNVVSLELGPEVVIGGRNKIIGANVIKIGKTSKFKSENVVQGDKNLIIGESCVVNSNNHFNISEDIVIKDNVVFAGKSIELWTHGYDHLRNEYRGKILIEERCYIGSSVKISYGVRINKDITVGMGTVVYKSLTESNCYYGSNSLTIIKRNFNEEDILHKYLKTGDQLYYREIL